MIGAVQEAQEFLHKKFPNGEIISGTYAVPTKTSNDKDVFMRIIVNPEGGLSGFDLFLNEGLTEKYVSN